MPFAGILPVDRPNNRPFYDALDGLIRSLEALGQGGEAGTLRTLRDRLSGGRASGAGGALGRPDPGM